LAISKEEADEITDADEGEDEDAPESQSKIRFIALDRDKPDTLYLGTDQGIKTSSDSGLTWKSLARSGLLEKRINFVLAQGQKVYAGTEKGLYVYDKDRESWQEAYKGIPLTNIKCLSYDETNDTVWIASNKGIYKTTEGTFGNYKYWDDFSGEPEINAVQKWAIEYAQVQPEKICRWRKQARIRALLPKVSVGWDQSKSDTYEIYTSASTNYCVNGPQDASSGWDLSVSWELGDLVWGTDQTSIDVRSRLMVQLRNDILDDVTRTYFERRRLQIELMDINANPKKRAEKELRIQELTANLDALTGSRFSAMLAVAKKH
jgi:ligand-binding sensor domain-containing protein